MYRCRYTFWDEKNFPGFKQTLSDLYDRSINNYYKEKHDLRNQKRDIECLNKIFPLIEYYYVSLIKLGYVDKKNYFNVLNQLKGIECISILKSTSISGVTVGKKISINPNPISLRDLNSEESFKLTVFHELGHTITECWNKDVELVTTKLFNNINIKNKLRKFGINSRNDLVNGFILLEDVLVQEVAEDVLYRSKDAARPGFYYYDSDTFPGIKYRSNYSLYTIFQELGLKFFRSFKFIDCFGKKTISSALNKCAIKGFYSNFIKNLDEEMSSDMNKMSDFALMLGCLGKVKNANYAEFGLGVSDNYSRNTYYYNLFQTLVNDRMIRVVDEKKNNY